MKSASLSRSIAALTLPAFAVVPCLLPVLSLPAQAAQPQIYRQSVTLPMHRKKGNCPKTLNLAVESRPYEGGSEHTVVLKTSAIAGTAKYADSKPRVVIFSAPLKPQYKNCVGWIDAEKNPSPLYNVWFQSGSVYFRFDLDAMKDRPDSAITYQKVVNGEPKIRYAIAD
ncbi:hypothetical protein [Alkalinema sp. FACHB-956]|uniref:hypothetical protein n=1 Tax=Alkalinema sp. FACHB-956 TaxID=2692768 RepID=UPI001683D4CA|nr:hypothetical protein [Alkalinema sp. FACHB-956]MBD2327471.1 hypothetical protein [Alkalinema sp. FACHB-956]